MSWGMPLVWDLFLLEHHRLIKFLGLHHEHQRPDRDNYVKVNFNNVPAARKPDYDIFPASSGMDFSGPYDYSSIMHYSKGIRGVDGDALETVYAPPGPPTSFNLKPNTIPSSGNNGVPYNGNTVPSKFDGGRLCKLYSNVCLLAGQCDAHQCGEYCSTAGPCSNSKCGSDFPPACCDYDPEPCRARKQWCSDNGCNFIV